MVATPDELGDLRTLTERFRALGVLVERTPLDYVQWLPMQLAFLEEPAKRRLLRLGNQWGGKTFVGLANCIMHCLGDHPFYDVPPPPVNGVVVTASWAQSVAIQEKLWHLLPKDELHPSTVYIDGHGFRGKNPVVKFRNGSKLWIKTTNQGGLSLAGGTYHFVHFDEPPKSSRVYAEMVAPLRFAGGGRPSRWLNEQHEQTAGSSSPSPPSTHRWATSETWRRTTPTNS